MTLNMTIQLLPFFLIYLFNLFFISINLLLPLIYMFGGLKMDLRKWVFFFIEISQSKSQKIHFHVSSGVYTEFHGDFICNVRL